jgi:predicted ATP-grasp superfamily ATP-dependent carboligase
VIAVVTDPRHFAARSNTCREVIVTGPSDDDLLETLGHLHRRLTGPAVLIPCTDLAVLALANRRTELGEFFRTALPEAALVEQLIDKSQFWRLAAEKGWPAPATIELTDRAAAERAAHELRMPAVLKPGVKSDVWQRKTKAKAYKVESGEELLELFDEIAPWGVEIVVQQWVDASDAVTCNSYFTRAGVPYATFVTRKLRQWPLITGTGSCGVQVDDPAVEELTRRVFSSIDFCGPGYLELKWDEPSGGWLIIEANVGRPTGRSSTADRSGVPLVYAMYCDLLDQPLPTPASPRDGGTVWVDVRRDLLAGGRLMAARELTVRDWARSLRGHRVHPIWDARDPMPFAIDLAQFMRKVAGAAFTKVKG